LAIRSPSEKNYNGAKLRKAADRDFYGWGSIFSLAIKSTPPHETISRKSEVSSIYKHKQRGVMNKVVAVTNLGITGFYLYAIVLHMIRPGVNTGYTRMLMFVCLATIPIAFMMAIIGGRDRWPLFVAQAKVMAAGGLSSVLLVAGLVVLLLVMPLGMLLGAWYGMGLRFGLLFLLYFTPVLLRLALAPVKASVHTAVTQAVMLFASFLIGIGIVLILQRFASGVDMYQRHLQVVWPGYGDAAKVFFAVCAFSLLNQLAEFYRAFLSLWGVK
jgi:hypothetical protein